jgi:hypothetical protein
LNNFQWSTSCESLITWLCLFCGSHIPLSLAIILLIHLFFLVECVFPRQWWKIWTQYTIFQIYMNGLCCCTLMRSHDLTCILWNSFFFVIRLYPKHIVYVFFNETMDFQLKLAMRLPFLPQLGLFAPLQSFWFRRNLLSLIAYKGTCLLNLFL